MSVSKAFKTFLKEAPEHQKIWMETVQKLDQASNLEPKTKHLAYLAVLAAARLESGVPFHTSLAKQHGASREEIVSAIMVGLPAVGNTVISSLPAALEAYDAQ